MADFLLDIPLGLLSLGIGFGLGSVVFLIVRGARWALLRADRDISVVDPRGRAWVVRIPLAPSVVRFWLSQRFLRMRASDRREREAQGGSADGVLRSEFAHPRNLVDETEEFAGCVAIAMVVLVALALVVLAVEAALLAVVAVVVGAIRFSFGRWQCEAVAPDGTQTRISAGSLRDARALSVVVRDSIERDGNVDAWR